MKSHSFTFPGRAISKDNEKIFNRQGRAFTSQKFKDYENYIRLSAKSQFNGEILTGDIAVFMTFYFRNKVRPDLTNLPKSICDALNKTVWRDDRQIVMFVSNIIVDKHNERVEMKVDDIESVD